jgi:hypothetical protein
MNDNDKRVTLIDFENGLKLLRETQTPYCLVGGLAVGMWTEEFLTPQEKSAFDLPIRSKDIDLRSAKEAATILALQLKSEGAITSHGITRKPKNADRSFPSFATSVQLPATPSRHECIQTTIEALSGMPLLDEYLDEQKTMIRQNGTTVLLRGIYLLDPCSLMICKLNAIHTRPASESDNDRKHATILSLVIPRFIERALERCRAHDDPYHPGIDAQRLAGFLRRDPWQQLIPDNERQAMLDACDSTL